MNPEDGIEDSDADKRADAMRDQLRQDVASWRSGEARDAGTKPVTPPPPRAPKQKTKPVQPASLVPTEKKPFKMSYDGMSDRDYATQRVKLGAR